MSLGNLSSQEMYVMITRLKGNFNTNSGCCRIVQLIRDIGLIRVAEYLLTLLSDFSHVNIKT